MTAVRPGDQVWIDCPDKGFTLGRIDTVGADDDGECIVQLRDGRCLRKEHTWPYFPPTSPPPDDNTELPELDAPNVLQNIKRRFHEKKIYTYCGTVLTAVNPYVKLDLYSDAKKTQYLELRELQGTRLPPHPYAVANVSFHDLVRNKRHQAIVISGESGAGKTETAKIVMSFLAKASQRKEKSGKQPGVSIEQQFLSATPILEAFGNAQTIRNYNSSRFGNYKRVLFDDEGHLLGAQTTTYLLESSRVSSHNVGERNYHIFYQLLAGKNEKELAEEFLLKATHNYAALYNDGSKLSKEQKEIDRECWAKNMQSFQTMGFDESSLKDIFSICAAILHLGEVRLKPTKDVCKEGVNYEEDMFTVENPEALECAGRMLGMDSADDLRSILEKHHMRAGREGNVTHTKGRTSGQAQHLIYSMMKILYQRLFHKIVDKINLTSHHGEDVKVYHVGILDIYGFEILEMNSFEQLLINLANERLLQFFLRNVIIEEQNLLHKEGLLQRTIEVENSDACINTLRGVLRILDDSSRLFSRSPTLPAATDEKMTSTLFEKLGDSRDRRSSTGSSKAAGSAVASIMKSGRGSFIGRPRVTRKSKNVKARDTAFIIEHFAGDVKYDTTGWLEKNNDKTYPEFERALRSSRSSFVRELATEDNDDDVAGERFASVSKMFCSNLDVLHDDLSVVHVHYIRCINPNHTKSSKDFDDKYIRDQLVNCGTVQLLHVMRAGFPHRIPYIKVRDKFEMTFPQFFCRQSERRFVEFVLRAYEVPPDCWFLGAHRLFYKPGVLQEIEELINQECNSPSSAIVQKIKAAIITRQWRVAKIALLFTRVLYRMGRTVPLWRSLGCRMLVVGKMIMCLRRARKNLKIKAEKLYAERSKAVVDGKLSGKQAEEKKGLPDKHFKEMNDSAAEHSESRSEADESAEDNCEANESVSGSGRSDADDKNIKREWSSDCRSTSDSSQEDTESEQMEFVLSMPMVVCVINDQTNAALSNKGNGFVEDVIVFDGIRLHAATIIDEENLSPLRLLDVTDEGTIDMRPDSQNVLLAFCQHPQKPNLLATVDSEGYFYIFQWRGLADDTSPPISMCWIGKTLSNLHCAQGPQGASVRKLAFHPKSDDQLYALWETSEKIWDQRAYLITVMERKEAFGEFELLCTEVILAPLEKDGSEFDFSVFEFTGSGDLLIVGGRAYLAFFSMQEQITEQDGHKTKTWTLVNEENYHAECLEVSQSNVISCLPLQHQIAPGGRKHDIVHFGLESGLLLTLTVHTEYGQWSFEGKIWKCGEDRTRPPRCLMGVPFRTPLKENAASRCKGISFKRRIDSTKFRCLENGRISNWKWHQSSWIRTWENMLNANTVEKNPDGTRRSMSGDSDNSEDADICHAAAWSHFRMGTVVVITGWGESDDDSGSPDFSIRLIFVNDEC